MMRFTSFLAVLSVVFFVSCQSEEELKRQRYITEGILVYKNNCANCHQSKGEGLAALYPPLANSDYLVNKEAVICLIRYGQQGPIVVNGKPYNRPMPAQPRLSDLEVAELVTYIYNEWGGKKKLISVKDVTPVLERCKK
ncbi:c-type cytochrome [Spirosoma areae]